MSSLSSYGLGLYGSTSRKVRIEAEASAAERRATYTGEAAVMELPIACKDAGLPIHSVMGKKKFVLVSDLRAWLAKVGK